MQPEISRMEPRQSVVDIPRKPKNKRKRNLIVAGCAVAGVVGITLALSRLRSAAPVVDRGGLWTDTVKRGPMLREVKGPGTLVPEQIRLITADTAGRVERIPLRPGAQVEPGTILLELSNPDVMLQALDAERQLAQAEADLINLRATTHGNTLMTKSSLATLEAQTADAERRAQADQKLATDGVISEVEARMQVERAAELQSRLEFERKRLGVVAGSGKEQIAAQQAQIERLKAVLRIPETQARDLALRLPAVVDTRNGVVKGEVSRISPSASQGSVEVDIALPAELPRGARPDLTVEGTIEIEKLQNVLYVGRPAGAQPGAQAELFKLSKDGDEAHRVKVRLGRSSVSTVEVLDGLAEGDAVILSDMSQWDSTDRVRLR